MFISIFDIDGTIARPAKQWARPHSCDTKQAAMLVMDPCRVAQDVPIGHEDLRYARTRGVVYCLSGRAEWSRHITQAWVLCHHGIEHVRMRAGGDLRESWVCKAEYLQGLARGLAGSADVRVYDDDKAMHKPVEDCGFWFIYCGR